MEPVQLKYGKLVTKISLDIQIFLQCGLSNEVVVHHTCELNMQVANKLYTRAHIGCHNTKRCCIGGIGYSLLLRVNVSSR